MRKIKLFSTVLSVCILMVSMCALVFGYDETKNYFVDRKMTEGLSYTSTNFGVTEEGKYPAYFRWKNNKTTGKYYIGFDQKRGDGSYGGGSRIEAKVLASTPSGGKVFMHSFHVDRWKMVIGAGENANFYTEKVVLSYN